MTAKDIAALGGKEWHHREASWLTLDQALFFFRPGYVEPGPAFAEHIERQVRLRDGRPTKATPLSDAVAAIDCDDVRLVIDGETGHLQLEPAPSTDATCLSGDDFDPSGLPDMFLKEVGQFRSALPQYRKGVLALGWAADLFVDNQRRHLSEALRSGHAIMVGRWHQVREPFRIIRPDQWRYFRIERDEQSQAPIARAGAELIFSPLVMRIKRKLSAKEELENAVVDFLVDQMRQNADRPIQRKTLHEQVLDRWGNLSDRNFSDLWNKAKSSSGIDSYGRPGRPKKIIAPTLVKL
jgi:hypothetical protein